MIDPKIKEAWEMIRAPIDGIEDYELALAINLIRNAYVQTEARARWAEFWNYHDRLGHCSGCKIEHFNKRHNWTLDDWVKEVEAELSK